MLGLALFAVLPLACGSGTWPGRPSSLHGKPKPPVAGDEAALARIRGDGAARRHPPKAYWVAAPMWVPVKSLAGVVTGRRSSGVVAVKLLRHDGRSEGWPDLCVYEEVTVKQEALAAEPGAFGPEAVDRIVVRAEVDCAVFEAAR